MILIVLLLLALGPVPSQAQQSASERMAARLQQEIGLGQADTLLFVEVTWPTTGQKQRFSNLAMDQLLRIREGDAAPIPTHLNRLSLSAAHH